MARKKNRTINHSNISYVGRPDNEGMCYVRYSDGSHTWMYYKDMPSWMRPMGRTTLADELDQEFSFI